MKVNFVEHVISDLAISFDGQFGGEQIQLSPVVAVQLNVSDTVYLLCVSLLKLLSAIVPSPVACAYAVYRSSYASFVLWQCDIHSGSVNVT
jgi:hypothetical protein